MVSILVPIYNVEKYIEKCARSLFGQTFQDLEFIFVDDASTDNSIELLKRIISDYDGIEDRVRIIQHGSNRGVACARNTAVDASEGDYILHVDSDDWLSPDFVETLVNIGEKESADVVVCNFMEVNANSSHEWKNEYCPDNVSYTKSLLRRKSLTHIIGRLFRRDFIIKHNLRTVAGIDQGEDYLITPRIAYYATKVSFVDRPIYFYNRTNSNSYTSNVGSKGIEQIIEVQRRLIEFFVNIPDSDIYADAIRESCIFNKLTCFYCAQYEDFKKISDLYSNIDWKLMNLKRKQKLIMWLSDHKMLRVAFALISLGKKMK